MPNLLAANTVCYKPYGLEEALEGIATAGYRYVELAAIPGFVEHVPLEADSAALSEVQRLLNDVGLIPISVSGHSDLTTPKGVREGQCALNICRHLGIGILNTSVGGSFNEDEDEGAFLANIHEFADLAAEQGVVIGIEIHGTLTGTGQKMRTLIEKVNHANVGINYDTANSIFFSDLKPEDDLPAALPRVIHCHLKDTAGGHREWNFPAIGQGHVDFRKVLALFQQGHYTGPFSAEMEFQGDPWPSLDKVNIALKDSYEYLVELGLAG